MATLGQAQTEQDTSMGYVMSQLPALVGEQMANQHNQALEAEYQNQQQQAQMQQQQGQVDQQAQQQQLQLQAEQQKAQLHQATEQADFTREKIERDQEHSQAMELGKFEHKNAMELARIQAKAKAQATKRPSPKK